MWPIMEDSMEIPLKTKSKKLPYDPIIPIPGDTFEESRRL